MAGRTTTSQQFRISDIPDVASGVVADAAAAERARQYALRERYTRLIARFSSPAERASEEARFAHRRYAKIMAMDSGHQLRAALSMLRAGQPLTAAEVAALVVAAERGAIGASDLDALLAHPQRLPAPDTAAEIRAYLVESGHRPLDP